MSDGEIGAQISGLFANRNQHRDFVQNAIEHHSANGCNVYIAVAFFTEADVIEGLLAKACRVRLIVRLGFPTNPGALERLMSREGVEVRYFTSHSFHPKLYIFGDEVALVGSANLTRSAILTNQEVVVALSSLDPRLTELASLFSDYWTQARVLDVEALKKYKDVYQKFNRVQLELGKLDQDVLNSFGETAPANITREKVKESSESLFLEEFKRTYQECVAAFNIVRSVYVASGYRKISESSIPLRLEIDSFISFVRETQAQGDGWMSTPVRPAAEQRQVISDLLERWKVTSWPHFEQKIVKENYPRLVKVFASAESVSAASDDDLFEALCTLHSFYDRFRFYAGGLPTWKSTFLKANEPKKARDSLAFLVLGHGRVESRMAAAIYDPRVKLNDFGQANVQELIGWINRDDLPIINGRTTKVLRYFGSDVRQLS